MGTRVVFYRRVACCCYATVPCNKVKLGHALKAMQSYTVSLLAQLYRCIPRDAATYIYCRTLSSTTLKVLRPWHTMFGFACSSSTVTKIGRTGFHATVRLNDTHPVLLFSNIICFDECPLRRMLGYDKDAAERVTIKILSMFVLSRVSLSC